MKKKFKKRIITLFFVILDLHSKYTIKRYKKKSFYISLQYSHYI